LGDEARQFLFRLKTVCRFNARSVSIPLEEDRTQQAVSQRIKNIQTVWLANLWVNVKKGKLPHCTQCRHIGGVVA